MKKIVFCLSLAALAVSGCNSVKKTSGQPTDVVEDEGAKPENVDHGSEQTNVRRVTGIVRVEPDCGAIIEVTYGDVIYRYYPMNLDPKFRKDGLRIKFAFTELENTKIATKCESINMLINVSDVTPVR